MKASRVKPQDMIYDGRDVEQMQAELAALRQQVEREQQLCRENADAALWLKNELETAKQQVQIAVDALENIAENLPRAVGGRGDEFGEGWRAGFEDATSEVRATANRALAAVNLIRNAAKVVLKKGQ